MTTVDSKQVNEFFGLDQSPYGIEDADFSDQPIPVEMPELTGDIGAQLAALVVFTANTQKATQRSLQRSEEAMERVEQRREIETMRKEAELQLAQGIVGVVGSTMKLLSVIPGAAGTTAGGVAGFAEGAEKMLEGEITHKKADGKHFANQATSFAHAAEEAKGAVEDAEKLADKAIDFFQQWEQGNAAAMQAALHRS